MKTLKRLTSHCLIFHCLIGAGLAVVATGCGREPLAAAPALSRAPAAAAIAARAVPAAPEGATRTFGAASDVAAEVGLDLLTYNTWGKPGILGKDEKARFELLGPALSPYGIVTLQETFTRHADKMGVASGFPHLKRMTNGGFLRLNAGLFTLSRYALVDSDFAKFTQAGDFDRFANKGVLFTRLSVPGVGEVDIYNTHYQSVQGEKFTAIRKHDNSVLASLVAKHAKGNPTFVMGDFNMTPDSPEYQDLKARLSFRDAFAEARPGEDGYTSTPENPNKKAEAKPKRVDYVFVLPSARHDITITSAAVVFKQPVGGKVLSDHFGIHARVAIRAKR